MVSAKEKRKTKGKNKTEKRNIKCQREGVKLQVGSQGILSEKHIFKSQGSKEASLADKWEKALQAE